MLTCVKTINEKVDGFYKKYESLWDDGYKKREKYEEMGKSNLQDVKNPDLAKLSFEKKKWNKEVITKGIYKDCFKSPGVFLEVEDYENDCSLKFSQMHTSRALSICTSTSGAIPTC